jgi:hypothetical protein
MAKKDFQVHIDLNNNQILNAALQNLSTAPSTVGMTPGTPYFNTTSKKVFVYTGVGGSEWLDLSEVYTHPTYLGSQVPSSDTTGATIISGITLTNGHVTGVNTRTLSASDIGAAEGTHTHLYTSITGLPTMTILGNNTGSTAAAKSLTVAETLTLLGVEAGANNYVHPTFSTSNAAGTALTDLNVISQITVGTNGHVTNIVTRSITADQLSVVIFDNASNVATNKTWTASKIYNEIQNAIGTAVTGAVNYIGDYNANTNTPNLGTDANIKKGYLYVVSTAGTFVGNDLEAGDMLIAKINNPGTTPANWQAVNKNIPTIVDSSESAKGIIQLATSAEALTGTDVNKAITPATLKAVLDSRVGGYSANFGDNSATTFVITHNLNSQDLNVQIQKVSDRSVVEMDVKMTSVNTLTIACNVAPTINQYRVIIKK